MKLFIIAALIAVSSAARLEHLEQQQQQLRAYLPPHQASFGAQPSFGAIAGAYGTPGSGQPSFNSRGSFPSASSQYLPPDHGPSAAVGSGDFAGSLNGFGAQNNQQYGQAPNQYAQVDAPQGPFGAQASFQPANSQYLAPHSSDNIPQQAFDEQTGYHY